MQCSTHLDAFVEDDNRVDRDIILLGTSTSLLRAEEMPHFVSIAALK